MADEMGLGKTLQILSLLSLSLSAKKNQPTLLLCPVSVIDNWASQAAQHAPSLKVFVYYGAERKKADLKNFDLIISSYSTMLVDASKGDRNIA